MNTVLASALYGRNSAIAKLARACRQIESERPVWILIEGPAGIGKTSLVHHVRTALQLSATQYASGKFEQFHRQTPYSALIAALRRLVQTVLNLPADERMAWQSSLRAVPGAQLAPLVDVLPELAFLLDDIAPPPPFSPKESQLRLEAAFATFIARFARPDHKLLLFLDDLQWADVATLRLLRSLGAETALGHLIIVGTCRDNELTPLHALTQTIEALAARQVPVNTITLHPITPSDLEEWLTDAYGLASADVGAPARWLAEHSEGNPLFVGQLLNSLREQGVLHKDMRDQRWHWRADKLTGERLAGSITSFMEDRLRQLSREQQALLSQAACLGTQFSLVELARIRNDTTERIGAMLHMIADAQLVESGQKDVWRFAHDRIQQAAYRLLPDPERLAQHLHIGRLLLAATSDDNLDGCCFDLAGQFNHAPQLLSADERLKVADLNLRAGRRAKASAAFEAALGYLRTGQSLLPQDAWQSHYSLAFELALQSAECAYAAGDTELADRLFESALNGANNRLDRSRVYGVMIMFRLNAGRAGDAWRLGDACLQEFGIALGTDPEQLEREIRQAEADIRERLAQPLPAQASALSAEQEAVGDLLLRLYPAGYQLGKQTYAYITMRMMEFALATGHPGVLAFGLINLAVIVIARHGAYAEADRYAQQALLLAQQLPDATLRARIDYVYGSMVAHWTQPVSVGLRALERCHEQAAATADKVYIGLALSFQFRAHIMAGEPVAALLRFWEKAIPSIRQIDSAPIAAMFAMNRQWLHAWMEETHAPTRLDSDDFDAAAFRAKLEALPAKSPYHWYALLQAILCYLHGRAAEARAHMAQADHYLDAVAGQLSIPEHHFWRGLIRHATGDAAALESSLALFDTWSANAPANFRHHAELLRAELLRSQGEREPALAAYQAAIAAARQSEHLLLLGLALERLGDYHCEAGLAYSGQATLQESIVAYQRWGAPTKVRALRARMPAREAADGSDLPATVSILPALAEIRLDRLLAQLLPLLMRLAQANRAFAIIDRNGQLMLEARHPAARGDAEGRLPIALEHAGDCPVQLIADACRTKRMIVNAQRLAGSDAGARPTAGLSLPVVRHGRLLGAFYLERADGDWPAQAAHTLEQAAEHIAGALENALLYADLEQQIGERSRAEKAAREGERRWRALLEHAHMAVLCLDLTGVIQYANPFLRQLSGYAEEELIGRDWTQVLLAPQFRAQPVQQRLIAPLFEEGHHNGWTKIITRAGDIRTIAWSNSLLRDPDGNPIGSLSIGSDMTDQRRAERALRQLNVDLEERVARRTAELEATNRDLDAFAYSISHDLRAPLRSIAGFSQAVCEDYGDKLDDTAQDYLQRVVSAAARMDGMIGAMLDMSRQTRGSLAIAEVDLSAMAADAIEELRRRYPERSVEAAVQADVRASADARLMRNVLDNLLDNAWKYAGNVAAPCVRFDVVMQDEEPVYCITDNGPGFDPALAAKLFTPFQRLPNEHNIEGYGIGLTTVQRIIHRHGGRIWVETAPGQGASFRFTLKAGA